MSSSRLPGKVLAQLGDVTVLELLLSRLRMARELSEVVVATSVQAGDDPVARAADGLRVRVVRGPLQDVLERYRQAAAATDADAVVRITADCPFVVPDVVDAVVTRWRETTSAYASNTLEPLTFPDGMDVEVISVEALQRAAALAIAAEDREHVTRYLRDRPGQFTAVGLWLSPGCGSARITLDTRADLDSLRALLRRVGPDASLDRILQALGAAPARMAPTPT